jgi:ArsR family transcriptional regulator
LDNLILYAKAFSDLNRLNILALIHREKELCVCEISDTLKLSQPLVSRHLKQLKEANILDSHKDGKWIVYSIVSTPSKVLQAYIEELQGLEADLANIVTCTSR